MKQITLISIFLLLSNFLFAQTKTEQLKNDLNTSYKNSLKIINTGKAFAITGIAMTVAGALIYYDNSSQFSASR